MAGGLWWAPYPTNGEVKSGEPLKEWNRENLTNDTDKKTIDAGFLRIRMTGINSRHPEWETTMIWV